MTWLQDWRESAADRALLRAWRRGGAFDAAGAARAHAALGGDPPSVQWAGVLDRLALWLGVALCAAGLLCFVAANWEHLGKTTRLYGLQALLVVCCVAALRAGLSRLAGQALLWLSMLVLGGVLALIGQTYQTGADAWELFALWAALSLPWVVAGRHVALWLTWAAIANVALGGWWASNVSFVSGVVLASVLGAFDALLLLAAEAVRTFAYEFRTRAARWLLSCAAMLLLSLSSFFAILDEHVVAPTHLAGLAVWCVATSVAGLAFGRWRRDLPALSIWLCGVAIVSVAVVWRLSRHEDGSALSFLFAGATVVVEASLAAWLLRRLQRGLPSGDAA